MKGAVLFIKQTLRGYSCMRIESAAAAVALAFAAASCGTRPVVQSEGHLQTAEVTSRSIGGTAAATGGGAVSGGANNSTLQITALAKHRFWETLEKNIKDLLRETDKQLPEGSSETFVQSRGQSAGATTQSRTTAPRAGARTTTAAPRTTVETPGESQAAQAGEFLEQKLTFREAASVIVNPETGIVSVRATSRQHEKVQEFLDQVIGSARRQVLIEATVVEVALT